MKSRIWSGQDVGVVYLFQDLYMFVVLDGMPVGLIGEFLDVFVEVKGVVFISQGVLCDLEGCDTFQQNL